MATPSKIQLSKDIQTEFQYPGLSAESASKASEVLQENHEKHHAFFNRSGFHNHIVHHILTIFALGASPEVIQKQYDLNASYQRTPFPVEETIVKDLHNPESFNKFIGDEKYYHDILVFFQSEMEEKGWESVLDEYLFARDERAEDMLVRLNAGFLHPVIHLGFGIEFGQPAIMAEALAQAACHPNWIAPLFFETEKAAEAAGKPSSRTLVSLLNEIRADKKLSTAAHWNDNHKVRDGIMVRAPAEMTKYASQYSVTPDQLEEKTAEMINAAIYFTGGAQHPPKQIKFDFYYMHAVNSSIFYSTFLSQPSFSTDTKCRLLEWKGRQDLVMYASRRSPEPLMEEITNYLPRKAVVPGGEEAQWRDIVDRVVHHEDDGHASKLVRALAHGQVVSKPWEKDSFRIKDGMWLKLGHMAIDSVEDSGVAWVRSAGFEEAWTEYEDRPRAQL